MFASASQNQSFTEEVDAGSSRTVGSLPSIPVIRPAWRLHGLRQTMQMCRGAFRVRDIGRARSMMPSLRTAEPPKRQQSLCEVHGMSWLRQRLCSDRKTRFRRRLSQNVEYKLRCREPSATNAQKLVSVVIPRCMHIYIPNM